MRIILKEVIKKMSNNEIEMIKSLVNKHNYDNFSKTASVLSVQCMSSAALLPLKLPLVAKVVTNDFMLMFTWNCECVRNGHANENVV